MTSRRSLSPRPTWSGLGAWRQARLGRYSARAWWVFFLAPRFLGGWATGMAARLALITPLLLLLLALNLMGFFFLLSWTPTLLTAAKLPVTTAALAGAVLQVGGTVGSLTLCWWLQRHRFLAITIMFVLA